mmetsp:Transcript_65677/g.174000  ORF Transcript_65677/g.174000 Transcript_65677/m.174000 type:complete len:114 (-) Transcript_65677:68-409(-)
MLSPASTQFLKCCWGGTSGQGDVLPYQAHHGQCLQLLSSKMEVPRVGTLFLRCLRLTFPAQTLHLTQTLHKESESLASQEASEQCFRSCLSGLLQSVATSPAPGLAGHNSPDG